MNTQSKKSELKHQSVLLKPVCDYLKGKKLVVDCTLGLGGHSEALLIQGNDKVSLLAFELDQKNLDYAKKRLEKFEKQIKYVKSNFSTLEKSLMELGTPKVDGILLDLGLSSPHVDDPDRGFSFRFDGPLDMRFSKDQELTAEYVINNYSHEELSRIIKEYGEDRNHWKIARKIVQRREERPILTTQELVDIVKSVSHPKFAKDSVARVFQAIRIEVNDELGVLKDVLSQAINVLAPGGRIVVISYHSLEDRIVKHFFKDEVKECVCPIEVLRCICHKQQRLKILTKRPIVPDEAELEENPRSRSAKMRVAERL